MLILLSVLYFCVKRHRQHGAQLEPDATSQALQRACLVSRTLAATERHAQDKVDPVRSPMLSLVGMSGAAFVMSCKLAVPLRPAMGKGLLRADATGTHPRKEHAPIMLQPQVGDSASAASQGSLPFGNGGQKQEVLASLGQSKRPPHARRAREALVLAHDSSICTPIVAATAVAIMLAFAPAKAQASAVAIGAAYYVLNANGYLGSQYEVDPLRAGMVFLGFFACYALILWLLEER